MNPEEWEKTKARWAAEAQTGARDSRRELHGFAWVFVSVGLTCGIGLIIYGFTDIERIGAVGTGFVVVVAGLWAGVIARALAAIIELLARIAEHPST